MVTYRIPHLPQRAVEFTVSHRLMRIALIYTQLTINTQQFSVKPNLFSPMGLDKSKAIG